MTEEGPRSVSPFLFDAYLVGLAFSVLAAAFVLMLAMYFFPDRPPVSLVQALLSYPFLLFFVFIFAGIPAGLVLAALVWGRVRPWIAYVVSGAGLGALEGYLFSPSTMAFRPTDLRFIVEFAVAGAAGGLAAWLCVRHRLTDSPKPRTSSPPART